MTRDELAQLLLCYIGTAADIIEFFDSFKVEASTIIQFIKIPNSGPEGEHRQDPLPSCAVHLELVSYAVHHHSPGV